MTRCRIVLEERVQKYQKLVLFDTDMYVNKPNGAEPFDMLGFSNIIEPNQIAALASETFPPRDPDPAHYRYLWKYRENVQENWNILLPKIQAILGKVYRVESSVMNGILIIGVDSIDNQMKETVEKVLLDVGDDEVLWELYSQISGQNIIDINDELLTDNGNRFNMNFKGNSCVIWNGDEYIDALNSGNCFFSHVGEGSLDFKFRSEFHKMVGASPPERTLMQIGIHETAEYADIVNTDSMLLEELQSESTWKYIGVDMSDPIGEAAEVFKQDNCEFVKCAVGKNTGDQITHDGFSVGFGEIKTETKSLEDLFRSIDPWKSPDVVVMDIENLESEVMEGYAQHRYFLPACFIIEVHSAQSRDEIIEIMCAGRTDIYNKYSLITSEKTNGGLTYQLVFLMSCLVNPKQFAYWRDKGGIMKKWTNE